MPITYLPGTTFVHTFNWAPLLPSGVTVSSATLAVYPSTWTLGSESATDTTHVVRVAIPTTASPGQAQVITSRATLSDGSVRDLSETIVLTVTPAGTMRPPKDPDDTGYPVTVDVTDLLPSGVTLSSASWTAVTPGLTAGTATNDTTSATLRVSGGVAGQDYVYEMAGTFSNSEVLRVRVIVPVRVQ